MRAISPIRARSAILTALVVGLALPVLPAPQAVVAAGPHPYLTLPPSAPSPDPSPRDDADDILIRYAPGTSAARRAEIERDHGLVRMRADGFGRSAVVRAEGRSIATVRRLLTDEPEVIAVAPNHRRELAIDPEDEPYYDELWALHNRAQRLLNVTGKQDVDIDAREAHAHALGLASIVVAVIDDGIDFDHPDLAARAWTNPGEAGAKATNGIDDDGNGYIDDVHGWDFCNDDNTVYEPGFDGPVGHGTHVAGTIAASLDGEGIVGVAPGVKLMALKFIDASGFCGRDDMAMEAIDYAASFHVPIINASWGGPADSPVLDTTIRQSDALVVAAAGNNGLDIDAPGGPRFYPASFTATNIISVTAITQAGQLAPFANHGTTSVDLAAPGTNILSTYPPVAGCPSPCYVWSAGTSMSAPHVAGVAALVASRSAALRDDPVALRARLLKGAAPVGGAAGTTVSGRMVNALRAIDLTAPKVVALRRFAIPTGTTVTATTLALAANGPIATDLLSGVASHQVQRIDAAGTPVGIALSDPMPTARTTLTIGQPYTFRVRAVDAAGNTSGWQASTPIVAQSFSEGSSITTFTGSWSNVSTSAALGGRLRRTTTDDASVTFRVTGRSMAVVGTRGPTSGRVRVYVDGVLRATVDLYRSSTQSRVVVFSTNWEQEGVHSIRLVADVSAARPRVEVDGAVVVRAAVPVRVQLPR